jgi:hypothetical protein
MNDISSWSLIILVGKMMGVENFMRRQLSPWYPLNKRLGRPQSRAGILEKIKVPWTYGKLIVLRPMYSVLIIFWIMCIKKLLAIRIIFSTLGLATTGIVSLQIDIRIIICLRITNMCKVCCMPTVCGITYDCALSTATKPMDQYFCWVLGVESRIGQVVGVIDQQPVRRGTAI